MSSQELRNALAEDPGNWELRKDLVEALVAEGLHEPAVEVVNQGEAIPREPGPWLAAAKCYAAVGAGEQARSLVATALEIDPDHEPSKEYQRELSVALAPTPVSLTGDDVEEETEEEVEVVAEAAPVAEFAKAASGGDEPIQLPKVSHSSEELEALHAAEEESKRRMEATIKRDKFNSIGITVLLHVLIVVGLMLVATRVPPNVPPQIVASTAPPSEDLTVEDTKLEKPTLEPTTAVNSAVADIISVSAVSDVSISNIDVAISDVAMEQTVMFQPSMSIGMPTSSDSKMMFGEPIEGKVLGVILDVSGSMAEYLPQVVREVDKNFENAPILYVRNMVIRNEKRDDEAIIPVIAEEVMPYNKELNTRTPYWFLWHDLPRKAPQRYVDKLIEMFKTRPNQFMADGHHWDRSNTAEAIDFLMEQDIDALYIFSDFEDFVDEDVALELGQKLGRRKVRTYLQPAEKGTENLDIMTKKIANRTLGRQMPSLVSILRGDMDDEDDPLSLTKKEDTSKMDLADLGVEMARPREERVGDDFYADRPSKDWFEIHSLSTPTYDAVFYGPEARAFIYLKDDNGKYIQNPIQFGYHSRKEIPDHPDPRHRWRDRKFLKLEEDPSFDGKEIVWKMVLEDNLKFRVHLYLDSRGMNATYVADPPEDETYDHPYIYFRVPELALEKEDRYFGYDTPKEGLKLDDVRKMAHPNTIVMDLPTQMRDQRGKQWEQRGFEPGYNTRHFDELIRHYPDGIRDMVVKGPAFGPRVFHARTVTNNVLLNAGAWRADTEPWEAFHANLRRPEDRRTGFRKSEAIAIEIE